MKKRKYSKGVMYMSNYVYTYQTIVGKAKEIKKSVEKEYKKPSANWSYYFAKAILTPKKNVTKITVKAQSHSTGNDFGRQITKSEYLDMAKRLVKYVESHNQMPNNIKIGSKLMRGSDYTYMFSRILVYYDTKGKLPSYANVNSKAFTKPTETGNTVYDYFVNKTGIKPTCLDDVCDWIKNKVTYQFYFDDKKSNKQVIDSKAGNCTDLLQFTINMAEALGYDWKVIHTQCKQSGTGHVYGKFKKKNSSTWFTRDVACIADESRYCVWCDVDNGGGYQLAVNPNWFLQNLRR